MDFFWWLLWGFWFVAYIYVVIVIITDLFRDEKLNGWLKALWIIALVFVTLIFLDYFGVTDIFPWVRSRT